MIDDDMFEWKINADVHETDTLALAALRAYLADDSQAMRAIHERADELDRESGEAEFFMAMRSLAVLLGEAAYGDCRQLDAALAAKQLALMGKIVRGEL